MKQGTSTRSSIWLDQHYRRETARIATRQQQPAGIKNDHWVWKFKDWFMGSNHYWVLTTHKSLGMKNLLAFHTSMTVAANFATEVWDTFGTYSHGIVFFTNRISHAHPGGESTPVQTAMWHPGKLTPNWHVVQTAMLGGCKKTIDHCFVLRRIRTHIYGACLGSMLVFRSSSSTYNEQWSAGMSKSWRST